MKNYMINRFTRTFQQAQKQNTEKRSNRNFVNRKIPYPSKFSAEHNFVYLLLAERSIFSVCCMVFKKTDIHLCIKSPF